MESAQIFTAFFISSRVMIRGGLKYKISPKGRKQSFFNAVLYICIRIYENQNEVLDSLSCTSSIALINPMERMSPT